MTTITYRNGVMAADTMMVRGDEKCFGAVKIKKIQEMLVGYAGSMFDAAVLFQWIEDAGFVPGRPCFDVPSLSEDGVFLIVHDGYIFNVRTLDMMAVPINREYEAIGSGAEYALGALACGISAESAVEVACKFDCLSGGRVHKVDLYEAD